MEAIVAQRGITAMRSAVMLTNDRFVDRRILLEADALEANGWDVTILSYADAPKGHADDPRVVRVCEDANRSRHPGLFLRAHLRVKNTLPNIAMTRLLKRIFWKFFKNRTNYFLQLYLPSALKYSPTVFVAHDLPLLPIAFAAARARGAKLIYDSHELFCEQEFSEREKMSWREIEARYIGRCDAVITVNQSIAKELSATYDLAPVNVIMNAERLTHVNRGIRHFHNLYGLSASSRVMLYQGGFSPYRNLDVLIDSFHMIKNESLHLVLLGDGVIEPHLRARATSGPARTRIHFHSRVSQSDLLEFTASADIGVIPYTATCRNNLLCTPNKLFEFIAAGVPIVATDLPEIREIVAGNGIGVVGDTGTPASFARLIEDVAGGDSLESARMKMGDAAKKYNWAVEGERYVRIFNECLGS